MAESPHKHRNVMVCVCVCSSRRAISQKWCVLACVCACVRACFYPSSHWTHYQSVTTCTHHSLTPRGNLESPNVLIYFIKWPLSVFEILIKHMYLLNVSWHTECTLIVWMCRCILGFECFDPLRMRQMCWINQQLAAISLFSHACKYEAALMTTCHLVSSNGHVRSH